MHLFKTLQNFLFDKEYFLSMWENYIHVYGFLSVEELNTDKIKLVMPRFSLVITGSSFKVLKLTKSEILIEGNLSGVNVYE